MPQWSACRKLRRNTSLVVLLLSATCSARFAGAAPRLALPSSSSTALAGGEIAARVGTLDLSARETEVYRQFLAGNAPEFLCQLCPVSVTNVTATQTNCATFFVTPEYLALGSDADYLLFPLSPQTAQRLADALDCSLPTRKMVDAIYAAAEVKLPPAPLPPSPEMTTVAAFNNHNHLVRAQRELELARHPLGALVAGHKKDVVISPRTAMAPGKVAIYGWHRTNGVPIQPLYFGHSSTWVDYSQCVRLVSDNVLVNGQSRKLAEVLADPMLCGLFSDEGVIAHARYDTNQLSRAQRLAFTNSTDFPEQIATLNLDPEVHAVINAPTEWCSTNQKPLLLVFYALPNGNSTAQTIGRKLRPGDDWHFDIQHIGAQTRFVRQHRKDRAVVVAYLENNLKSWPAWRKKYGDAPIPTVLNQIEKSLGARNPELVLSGHSGGGSLIFGYLNAIDRIPDNVVRIAFLDSTYAYEPARGHAAKLTTWLQATQQHYLCVLAYNDAVALLDGKPFVTPAGGTWGKSHQMQSDLAHQLAFMCTTNSDFEKYVAQASRVEFLLRQNPRHEVLHTIQVERNGFIHALLSGTALENTGYTYFGPRAYEQFIAPD